MSLLVWVLPIAGVILGCGALVLAFRRWRRPAAAPSPEGPAGDDPAVDSAIPAAGPAKRPARILVSAVGVVLVIGGSAWALAASTGHRLPGEEISGQALGSDQVAADLLAAQSDEQKNPPDVVGALKEYHSVLVALPDQVEALTGEGWLLAQTGQPSLLQQGLTLLQQAEAVQPAYAPAHVYRGIALYSEGDYAGSVPELQWYLDHNPDPQLVSQVNKTLSEARSKAAQTPGS